MRRPGSRPAWLGRRGKGLSQASRNKLRVNNSAAARGLIALAPPPVPPLEFQLRGGQVTIVLEEGSQIEDSCLLASWIPPGPIPGDPLVPDPLGPHRSEGRLLGRAVPA